MQKRPQQQTVREWSFKPPNYPQPHMSIFYCSFLVTAESQAKSTVVGNRKGSGMADNQTLFYEVHWWVVTFSDYIGWCAVLGSAWFMWVGGGGVVSKKWLLLTPQALTWVEVWLKSKWKVRIYYMKIGMSWAWGSDSHSHLFRLGPGLFFLETTKNCHHFSLSLFPPQKCYFSKAKSMFLAPLGHDISILLFTWGIINQWFYQKGYLISYVHSHEKRHGC